MPEYLSPGVYVEEVALSGASIEGVSTSTAAFIGETERGPATPHLISGPEEYQRLYGKHFWSTSGAETNSYMPDAVDGFFSNGGKRCFIVRILGQGSKTAEKSFTGAAPARPVAPVAAPVAAADARRAPPAGAPEPAPPAGNSAFKISAVGPGAWGKNIRIKVGDSQLAKVNTQLASKLFNLTVEYRSDPDGAPTLVENYISLAMDPAHPNFYERRINGFSSLIRIDRDPAGNDLRPANSEGNLDGGAEGARPVLGDFTGSDAPGKRSGLAALAEIDEISMVCAPNENEFAGVTGAIVDHCTNLKNRFAILQASDAAAAVEDLVPPMDSDYAAFYYPWLRVIDPHTGTAMLVPPGGHVAGIYARTDIERGVFKAPANEVVRGITGLQLTVKVGEQDVLNPRGVNCIRALPGRGIRVWGARTASSDPLWKYVNVRRFFIFLEESIRHGTQWVVFEPNNERLWDRVRQTVADFLTGIWRDGGLMGRTREEAFFVKCDRTTMTQNDIDVGRLIVIVGVAAVKPAEFVIFRIAQWRGPATET